MEDALDESISGPQDQWLTRANKSSWTVADWLNNLLGPSNDAHVNVESESNTNCNNTVALRGGNGSRAIATTGEGAGGVVSLVNNGVLGWILAKCGMAVHFRIDFKIQVDTVRGSLDSPEGVLRCQDTITGSCDSVFATTAFLPKPSDAPYIHEMCIESRSETKSQLQLPWNLLFAMNFLAPISHLAIQSCDARVRHQIWILKFRAYLYFQVKLTK